MGVKLAFTTLGCPDWSFEQILAYARDNGFYGVEIRGLSGEMRAERMREFMPGRQQDTLRMVQDSGVKLVGFGASASFHDPEMLAAAVEEGRMAIDVCARMGIPYIRVFGDAIPDPAQVQRTIDQVAGGISRLCDYAKGTGVGILLEAHGEFTSVDVLHSVIKGVGSDSFGILWDIGNSDEGCGDAVERFYEPLKPYIRHLHVKDILRDGKGTIRGVGRGDLPIPKIVNMLLDDGFDGCFAYEWEKKWHPELDDPEEEFPKYIKYMKGLERA